MFTSVLIGMGIDTLSMSTSRILRVKQFLKHINYSEVKKYLVIFLNKMIMLIKKLLESYYTKINKRIRIQKNG